MTLDTVMKEMVTAMKAKDKARKDVISSLVDAIKKAAIDKNCRNNISEDMVDAVILKEQKTVQEMIDTCPAARTDLLESYKYRLEVIKERLNIKNNIRLIIDGENSKLNYTEFRAAIQLKNKNYSQLTTDQLLLLQNKLLFYLEDEIDVHIKQWESRIAQIDEVRKLKGYDLRING